MSRKRHHSLRLGGLIPAYGWPSIKLLNRIGFDVFVPKQQTCCGAIHLHQGQKDIADKIAALNTDVFNSLDIKAIIYTATAAA